MKTNMKTLTALLLSGSLMLSSVAGAGGIPTFDSLAVAQAIKQGFQMAQQIKNQVKQLDEMKRQAEALTTKTSYTNHISGGAKSALNDAWNDYYGEMVKKGTSAKDYDAKDSENARAKMLNTLSNSLKHSEKRINELNNLMRQINQSQDAKSAADLGNAINAMRAEIQQNQMQIDNAWKVYQIQKEQNGQRQLADYRCRSAAAANLKISGC